MSVTVIVGLQWGDEGKGRIVDVEAKSADIVARFNAGPNAGHTVVIGEKKYVLHLVPAGIFQPNTTCLIANGTVVDPFILVGELNELEQAGIPLEGRLWVSPRCHLILPYHRQLDKLHEQAKGAARTGTTGRGIGPVHADKVSYLGLRVGDLLRPDLLRQRLNIALGIKNRVLVALGGEQVHASQLWHDLQTATARLAPLVRETYPIIQDAISRGRTVLMAGANGTLLDNDFGTYPFCTAATTLSSGVGHGAGIAPRQVAHVVGIMKAYMTRVGTGPFPSELTTPPVTKMNLAMLVYDCSACVDSYLRNNRSRSSGVSTPRDSYSVSTTRMEWPFSSARNCSSFSELSSGPTGICE